MANVEWHIAQGHHVLLKVDTTRRTGVCSVCGETRVRRGKGRWRCSGAAHKWDGNEDRDLVGDHCERCGFVPEDVCQLDVHHVGRFKRGPIQTLCANCHRLITKLERA